MSDAEAQDTNQAELMSLREVTAHHLFRLILPERLPTVALDAMVNGHDSPHLRLLAGSMEGAAPHELHELFDAAMTELGLLPMRAMTAAQLVIRSNARGVAAGRVPPMDALNETVELFVLGGGLPDSFPDLQVRGLDLDTLYDLWVKYECSFDYETGLPLPKRVEQVERKVLDEFRRIAALAEPGLNE